MRTWLLALVTLASLFLCPAQEKRKQKPDEIEMLDFRARRLEDNVQFDGRVRNLSEVPLENVQLIFYFVSPDKKVVSTRQAFLDVDVLDVDEETEFMLQTTFPVRAVSVRLEAYAKGERYLRLKNSGPFTIQ